MWLKTFIGKECVIIITDLLHGYLWHLFPDTKLGKNIIQSIFCSYLAGYFSQCIEAGADVERNEVAGYIIVQAIFYVEQ